MKKILVFINHHRATLLISSLSLMAVCCSTKYLIPTQVDVPIAQSHWASTTLDDLTKGYSLYADKCTDCHGLKKPQKFTEDQWNNKYMPSMGKKAKLSPDEYALVQHYILTKREEIISPKK
jgi:cytochrome c5